MPRSAGKALYTASMRGRVAPLKLDDLDVIAIAADDGTLWTVEKSTIPSGGLAVKLRARDETGAPNVSQLFTVHMVAARQGKGRAHEFVLKSQLNSKLVTPNWRRRLHVNTIDTDATRLNHSFSTKGPAKSACFYFSGGAESVSTHESSLHHSARIGLTSSRHLHRCSTYRVIRTHRHKIEEHRQRVSQRVEAAVAKGKGKEQKSTAQASDSTSPDAAILKVDLLLRTNAPPLKAVAVPPAPPPLSRTASLAQLKRKQPPPSRPPPVAARALPPPVADE